MSKRSIRVPDDVAELAEMVVEASKDRDFDEDDLLQAVSYAIMADRLRRNETPKRRGRRPLTPSQLEAKRLGARRRYQRLKEDDPEVLREHWRRTYHALCRDPLRWRRMLDKSNARMKAARKADPERFKEIDRKAWERKRLRDPEEQKARTRARYLARKERDPEGLRQKGLRCTRRAWAKKNASRIVEAIMAAIPTTFPDHARNDILQAATLPVLDGKIGMDELKSEVRRQIKAYWREREEYRLASFDAPFSDGDGRTLHDITSG